MARGVALAHNRLSILDLTDAGHQPMLSEDGRAALVYNGELYNFRELRRELQALGHVFRSNGDTEVVLKSFLQWGAGCVRRFCGMFAFGAWSAERETILLARDPLGMKPLYYTTLPGRRGVAFASEVKAFLDLPGFRPRFDRSALRQYLEFGYTFSGDATSLQGVKKLPPGHVIELRRGIAGNPLRYFEVPPVETEGGRITADRDEQLLALLSEVVEQHLVADVPVGLLLSGGLDSSLVAALAARRTRVQTISMGFADSVVDERPFARQVSQFIGSENTEIIIRPDEVREDLTSVVWYFDDLFADWGTVSTRLLYKKCREQGIKVVLVGEGADELWGGYPIFQTASRLRGPLSWRLFQLYRHYAGRRYGLEFPRFNTLMRDYLHERGGDLVEAVRCFEVRNQLPNNYVMKVDKASMAVSVEARAPFLDRRVAEVAFRTPASELLAGGGKGPLRSVAERYGLLPTTITRREKFGAAIATSWLVDSEGFRQYARSVVLDQHGWVDELGLRRAMTQYFSGSRTGYPFPHPISIFGNLAWRLLLLNLWSARYSVT